MVGKSRDLPDHRGWRRHALQLWVLAVAGSYCVWFWSRGGQTLPMKTWGIRVVRWDGAPVGAARALHRYLLALLGLAALGLGYLWALADRDRQFLHDRLAGTALVDARGAASAAASSPLDARGDEVRRDGASSGG